MSDEYGLDASEPIPLFQRWMQDAELSELNDPNAAALATATASGRPSVRMVLVKRVDDRGFCFFSNGESRKGNELEENPEAALCFHWKSLRRQVRVEGRVSQLDSSQVEDYFHSRSRRSQLGAAVSEQSRPLASRELLVEKVRKFGEEHPEEVPKPSHWLGYCVSVERIEFWIDGQDRLHDRMLYKATDKGWQKVRLYP